MKNWTTSNNKKKIAISLRGGLHWLSSTANDGWISWNCISIKKCNWFTSHIMVWTTCVFDFRCWPALISLWLPAHNVFGSGWHNSKTTKQQIRCVCFGFSRRHVMVDQLYVSMRIDILINAGFSTWWGNGFCNRLLSIY